MREEQKIITAAPNYTISNYGFIRNIKKNKKIKLTRDKNGVVKVGLMVNGVAVSFYQRALIKSYFGMSMIDLKKKINEVVLRDVCNGLNASQIIKNRELRKVDVDGALLAKPKKYIDYNDRFRNKPEFNEEPESEYGKDNQWTEFYKTVKILA